MLHSSYRDTLREMEKVVTADAFHKLGCSHRQRRKAFLVSLHDAALSIDSTQQQSDLFAGLLTHTGSCVDPGVVSHIGMPQRRLQHKSCSSEIGTVLIDYI